MTLLAAGAAVAVCAAYVWWRVSYMRALTKMTTGRPFDATGVVIGGEGFVMARAGAPAVLLLHGAGDTPQTLRYLATALHGAGLHVAAPLLPGHGRTIREFSQVTADALSDAARLAYDELRHDHDWIAVIGLSMGGALAVQLAGNNAELPALGLLAPYLAMPPRIELFARLSWLWGALVPAVRSGDGISVLDPVERERSLASGVFTATALRALRITMKRAVDALPSVTAPTLVVQSRTDNRISVADAERAFALLGARDKRIEWVTGAAHIITVDYGRDVVAALVIAWLRQCISRSSASH